MRTLPVVWIVRVCWLALPFTSGAALGPALAPHARPFQMVATALAWLVWGVVLVASMAPHPITLTALRTLTPLAPAAGAWALLAVPDDAMSGVELARGATGLALAIVAVVGALSGWTADAFVDAGSYGDERRFALRCPGMFLLGPIPAMWGATAAAMVAGPLLVASRQWLLGAITCLAAVGLGVVAARAFHGLSTRWIVFVPAGVTLVDHLALADPVLLAAKRTVRLAPALADTAALDLSGNALGLALEVTLDGSTELSVRSGAKSAELAEASAVVFTPARPAAVLAEARRRGLVAG